ncbi:metallophosphoesterase [Corallococcus macrosporus]|uniref:Metallophosphoesterase n=1 Tax=Corallococcus macrosporus DSM 14697 TaxID=1189310 RepID=A0A250JSX5_9BACT|nr:metallophosphoesterase [Corallococcus macrosporus]ATB46935.1 metallophosphoesterase [Corallococcus macrosporus DSM 14697]
MHRKTPLHLATLAASLTLLASTASAGTLYRDPYLQKVGPDTATVAFRLAANCQAEVRYGEGAADQSAVSQDSGKAHAVVLTGLKPGTEYTYEVSACGLRTPLNRFRTAPVPGTRSVHFITVGDFGTGGSNQRKVVSAMVKRNAELFVALGDNAYADGTEAEIQNNLFVPMEALLAQVPFFAALGNHEYVTNQGQPYLDNLYLPSNNPEGTERYYSFDWGHVHFVALDSNCAVGLASADRCTRDAQKTWLERDLAGSTQPWKIVFFHHPPWSSGEHGSQLSMRRHFGPIMEKYGVDLVLTGHDHNYERSKPMKGDGIAADGEQGIPYLVVGGGGATLRQLPGSKPDWSVIRDNQTYGFLDVTVVDGTLTAELMGHDGTTADRFTLQKDLPPQEPLPEGELALVVEGERGVAPHRALFRATPTLTGAAVTWDFGDGGAAEGEAVEHVFALPGQYTVTATATQGAVKQTATALVQVAEAESPGEEPQTPDPGTPDTGSPSPRPGLPDSPEDPDDGLSASSGGCAAGPTATLLPASLALLAAGLLYRRRK